MSECTDPARVGARSLLRLRAVWTDVVHRTDDRSSAPAPGLVCGWGGEVEPIFQMAGDLLSRHASDGTFRYASPAARSVLGWSPSGLQGRGWQQIVHPADLPGFVRWWAALRAGRPKARSYRVCRPDGSTVWVETVACVVLSGEQHVVEVQAITRDVSTSVERAEELDRQRAYLEQRIAALEAANEHLARFAADAAHDLRAPLQIVTGFAQVLANQAGSRLDETSQRCVAAMRAAAGDMARLVDSALEHGRAVSSEPRRQRVECTGLVQQVLARLGVEIERARASIKIDELPVVEADEVLLGRVFQNLLSNACKAAPPGSGIRIVVSGRRTTDGWELRVTDDGTGVPEEDRQLLFRLFQRGRNAAKDGGSGLGLAICKTIVTRHGGHIWVEQAPGGGSTFAFSLPRVA